MSALMNVWSNEDYIAFLMLLLPLAMIWIDFKFNLIGQIIPTQIQRLVKPEDCVFLLSVVYGLIALLIKEELHLSLIFGGIVDFFDYEYDVIYYRTQMIVDRTLLFGMIAGPFVCSAIAIQYGKSAVKWFVYGLFMNVYGIVYIYLNRKYRDAYNNAN